MAARLEISRIEERREIVELSDRSGRIQQSHQVWIPGDEDISEGNRQGAGAHILPFPIFTVSIDKGKVGPPLVPATREVNHSHVIWITAPVGLERAIVHAVGMFFDEDEGLGR